MRINGRYPRPGHKRQIRTKRGVMPKRLLSHEELKVICNKTRQELENIVLEAYRRCRNTCHIEKPIAQALTEYGAEVRGKVRIAKVCRNGMRAIATVLVRIFEGAKRVAISLNVLLQEQPLRA